MRSDKEIKQKLNEMYNKELLKKQDKFLTSGYLNCQYNKRIHVKDAGKVGFCNNEKITSSVQKNVFICNDDKVVSKCTQYKCKNSKGSIEKEFKREISVPAICGQRYPKIAILMWCLHGRDEFTKDEIENVNLTTLVKSILNNIYKIISFKWL